MKKSKSLAIVILGATGDLARKKLFPSLFKLFQKGKLSEKTLFLGFGRRDWDHSDFKKFIQKEFNFDIRRSAVFKNFLSQVQYHQGFFDTTESFGDLAEKTKNYHQKIFFLAISPDAYEGVITSLGMVLQTQKKRSKIKLLIEKPFGKDLLSARKLHMVAKRYFTDKELFFVDHYLGKEVLHRLIQMKPKLQKKILGIHITLSEKNDVVGRHTFYDSIGALRDVGQNHLLETLATVMACLTPRTSTNTIQSVRSKILKSIHISKEKKQIRAQYDGYQKELGKKSDTETYFRLGLKSSETIFQHAPLILEAGKALQKYFGHITILTTTKPISIRIQPRPYIDFGTGRHLILEKHTAYEHVFLGALSDDLFYFPSLNEIYASWKITDSIRKDLSGRTLSVYKKGSDTKNIGI